MKNNNFAIENIFSIPLYVIQLEGPEFNTIQNEIKNNIPKGDIFHKKTEWGDSHYITSVNFSKCCIDEYKLVQFRKTLNEHLKNYCDILNFKPTNYYSESWLTLFKKNDYGHSHTHGSSDISGTYYYKTNEKDGNIVFTTPVVQAELSKCFINTITTWEHKPKEGKLLLFPAFLRHHITRNTTDNERMSLSFNIYFSSGI
jgi:uncharacterized protein (TIGR02466 family)